MSHKVVSTGLEFDEVEVVTRRLSEGLCNTTVQSADADSDFSITFLDIVYLADYFFKGGATPASP